MHVLALAYAISGAVLAFGATVYRPDVPGRKSDSAGVFGPRRDGSHPETPPLRRARLVSKQLHWLSSGVGGRPGRRPVFNTAIGRSPTPIQVPDPRPTPAPTGDPTPSTTVHIADENDFSLLAPERPGELISEAEKDGVSFCSPGAAAVDGNKCSRTLSAGFVTAAHVQRADDGSYIQITGCVDPSKSTMSPSDDGGQFDVRFPNGAQCSFGGYGASFIQQVEPSAKRFCLRCCVSENDQANCNSHQDRAGCPTAIPGVYDFPQLGISCL